MAATYIYNMVDFFCFEKSWILTANWQPPLVSSYKGIGCVPVGYKRSVYSSPVCNNVVQCVSTSAKIAGSTNIKISSEFSMNVFVHVALNEFLSWRVCRSVYCRLLFFVFSCLCTGPCVALNGSNIKTNFIAGIIYL